MYWRVTVCSRPNSAQRMAAEVASWFARALGMPKSVWPSSVQFRFRL